MSGLVPSSPGTATEEAMRLSRGEFLLGVAGLLFCTIPRGDDALVHITATKDDRSVADVLAREPRIALKTSTCSVGGCYVAAVDGHELSLTDTRHSFWVRARGVRVQDVSLSQWRVRSGDVVSVGRLSA